MITYIHLINIHGLTFSGIFSPYVEKYDKIFKTNYAIFNRSTTYPLTKKIEEIILVDENVLEIKNLVNKIGDLSKITL